MKRLVLILSTLALALTVFAEDVQFRAEAPGSVVAGNRFSLVYSVNQESKDFRAPEMPDFDILMGPSTSHSSSVQIINGNINKSMTVSYTYVLLANTPGTYTIPGATIVAGGEKYTSNSLTIKVLPPDQAQQAGGQSQGGQPQGGASLNNENSKRTVSGNNQLFMRQIISKTKVYEQEVILVTYKLYTRMDIKDVGGFKFPDYKGFFAQDVELDANRQWITEHYNGLNYNTVVVRQVLLFPQQSGTLEIEPSSVDVIVVTRVSGGGNNIFDGFFDSFQDVRKTITVPASKIEVMPLPAGAPKSFNGAVGSFDVHSSISTQNLKANDAVTVKVNISGNGNFKLLKSPELEFPADFDVYDPKIENKFKATAAGVSGSRSVEYLAIPRFGGDFEIKGAEFSWFDPSTKSYKSATIPDYAVAVEGVADQTQLITTSTVSNKESVKNLGSDIRHIHSDAELKEKGSGFYGTPGFVAGYAVPLAVFILLLIILQKQARENANVALKRNKRASKVAVKRLKSAAAFMKKDDKSHFYEETMKALWGYLSDKLSIPQADLTKDNVREKLQGKGVDDAVITEFLNTLQDCEFARFSSVSDESLSMKAIYGRATDLIENLEDKL